MTRLKGFFTLTRATNAVLVFIAVAVASLLPIAVSTLGNTDAQRRSDKLSSCRAEYRVAIDTATATRADANDALAVLNAQIFKAAVESNPIVVDLIAQAELASRTVEAAARAAKSANEAYADAVTLSRLDPDGFLETCDRLGGPPSTNPTTPPSTTATTLPPPVDAPPDSTPAAAPTTAQRRTTTTTTAGTTSTTATPTTTPPSPPGPTDPPEMTLLELALTELCAIAPTEPLCEVQAQ